MATPPKDHPPAKVLWLVVLVTLLGLSPRSEQSRQAFEQAEQARQSGSYQAAAVQLAILAEQLPWRTGLWEGAGHYALAAGESQLAGQHFAEAARQGELSTAGYLAWGEADWLSGQPKTALQIWQLAYTFGAPPQETLNRLADAYRSLADQPALIETLQNLLAFNAMLPAQEKAAILSELGLLLAVNEPAKAPPYLLQAIEFDSSLESDLRPLSFTIQRSLAQQDQAYSLLAAGRFLANQGRWDLAASAFENAIIIRDDYAEAWAYAAEAWQQLGQAERSLPALQRALALTPGSLAANSLMALYWQRQGDYEQARAYLEIAHQSDPSNPNLLVDLGNLVALQGDLQSAQDYYRQAIQHAPTDPAYLQAWIEFCVRYNIDLRTTALPAAREALLRYPQSAGTLDAMGQVLYRLGDLLNAERFYQRALQADPRYSPTHLHLGILYLLRQQAGAARLHLETVLELAPNSPQALQAQRLLADSP
ncbi:MAG: tetratricopeptide repeat protein [Anaerolineales bacterium]|nr:tetratricopeptide repeat protein [Anaerolineales bacterium]